MGPIESCERDVERTNDRFSDMRRDLKRTQAREISLIQFWLCQEDTGTLRAWYIIVRWSAALRIPKFIKPRPPPLGQAIPIVPTHITIARSI